MKTALILSTYPLKKLYHGGQNRLYALEQAYKVSGYETLKVAVFEEEAYQSNELSENDISFPESSPYRLFEGKFIPNSTDILAGDYLTNDNKSWKKFSKLYEKHLPDIVHFEQPGLFPAVKKILNEFSDHKPHIIYGSQNIEAPLKNEIYKQLNITDKKHVKKFLKQVKDREINSAKLSNMTLVVTEFDRNWFLDYIPSENMLIIPNGVRKMSSNPSQIRNIKEQIKAERWAVYIASAHPPNISGFFDCIGESLGCIPPDAKLVVAGSVSDFILQRLRDSQMRFLNQSRLYTFGKVNTSILDTLIIESEAVLLPITQGGGSNLKTAEALVSGKRIVATSKAFDGFEKYKNVDGITFADSLEGFRKGVRSVFLQKTFNRSRKQQVLIENLYWENIVKPLSDYLTKVQL